MTFEMFEGITLWIGILVILFDIVIRIAYKRLETRERESDAKKDKTEM